MQVRGLIEGGVGHFLFETIFDTLNSKAALFRDGAGVRRIRHRAADHALRHHHRSFAAARYQDKRPEAFWYSLKHAAALLRRAQLLLWRRAAAPLRGRAVRRRRYADRFYPNAGLPNAMGEYDETAEHMAASARGVGTRWPCNFVGGCCGTTPEHIRAIADAVAKYPPRALPDVAHKLRLSGLEPLCMVNSDVTNAAQDFVMIGERTNVTGSPSSASRSGERLRRCAGGRARPGRERRQHPRRQHGRRHARFRSRHDDVSQPDRGRAESPGAHHDRLLEMVGDRGGVQMRARQGHRQLHQP